MMSYFKIFLRLIRHSLMPHWRVQRHFNRHVLTAIKNAIMASEHQHNGELRLVIEGGMPFDSIVRNETPRQRATALFAMLGVWDTAENSGILIYVQLVERKVEILVDRGINAKVDAQKWQALCQDMQKDFAAGRWQEGAVHAIAECTRILRQHFPARTNNPDELPDLPLLL